MTAHMQRVHPKVFKSRANIRTHPGKLAQQIRLLGHRRTVKASHERRALVAIPTRALLGYLPARNQDACDLHGPSRRSPPCKFLRKLPPLIVLENIRFQTLQFRTLRLAFTDAYRGSPERVFKQGKYLRRECPGECWYVIEKGVNSTSGFWQHIGIFEDIDLVIAGRVVRAFPFRKLPKMLCLWAKRTA